LQPNEPLPDGLNLPPPETTTKDEESNSAEHTTEEARRGTSASITPILPKPAVIQQTFWYAEKIDTNEFEGKWTVEKSEDQTTIKKTSPYNNSNTIYNKDGHLQFIENRVPSEKKTFEAAIQKDGTLQVTASLNGNPKSETLKIADKGVWIQQPLFGLQNFARSSAQEVEFFFVHPEKLTLVEMRAKKVREESIKGLGSLLRIEANLNDWRGRAHTAVTWVDPKTGFAKKADCPSLYIPFFITIPHMTEVFLPNHP
jgi:hypothetical protein